jgi:hypothetical protein
MADRQMGFSVTMALVVVLVLAALAVAAWQLGLFQRGSEQDEQTTYEAGVVDESGGELIVTDPAEPRIEDLELPKTPMTPVPPSEQASPTASSRTGAE